MEFENLCVRAARWHAVFVPIFKLRLLQHHNDSIINRKNWTGCKKYTFIQELNQQCIVYIVLILSPQSASLESLRVWIMSGVTTMKRLDQSHLHPLLEHPGNPTRGPCVAGEHSSKELLEQRILVLFGTYIGRSEPLQYCKNKNELNSSIPSFIIISGSDTWHISAKKITRFCL